MRYTKKMQALRPLVLLLTLCLPSASVAAEKLQIYTVNYPLAYLAERIAGDQAEVVFPAPRDVDPAFWMPGADTIAAYQGADLILLNGAGYAKWTTKVSLPRLRLVDTSRGFKDAHIEVQEAVNHSHGPGGLRLHAHGGTAFTTWLDVAQAVQQAEAIAAALTRKRPNAKGQIDGNLESLKRELLALDERLTRAARSDPNRPLLGSHPLYQYLARRYGLNLKSVTWEPGEVASKDQWARLEQILKDHPAQWMLWEGEPATENVERLRRLGVESLVFDPCGNVPKAGDLLSVMWENAASLERVYR